MCCLYLEAVAVNDIMRSKELSIQVKQTIVRLQNQNRSIRERESRNIRSDQINNSGRTTSASSAFCYNYHAVS